jgi:hypothetical protein
MLDHLRSRKLSRVQPCLRVGLRDFGLDYEVMKVKRRFITARVDHNSDSVRAITSNRVEI